MASDRSYLDYILEQLSGAGEISHRPMMGEYVLYCGGKVIGGIYDDRFLVKPTKSARAMMPDAILEPPCDGAKDMILVDRVEDRDFLAELVRVLYDELPTPKKKAGKER